MFGFRSEGDVLRWALHNGLDELARRSKDKDVTTAISELSAWIRLGQEELENSYYTGVLDAVASGLRRMSERGQTAQATALAEWVWQASDKVESSRWRGQFRKLAKAHLDKHKADGNGKA
jgi:hypothetical protein